MRYISGMNCSGAGRYFVAWIVDKEKCKGSYFFPGFETTDGWKASIAYH